MEKKSFWESFKVSFGIGALLFGTYCGANMASGAYAAGYMVTVGGGWMLETLQDYTRELFAMIAA